MAEYEEDTEEEESSLKLVEDEYVVVLAEPRHLEAIVPFYNDIEPWRLKDRLSKDDNYTFKSNRSSIRLFHRNMSDCDLHRHGKFEKMKTVSVVLAVCLNIPVDPPDVVKLQPCARLEAWIDPLSMPPNKAAEAIGASLQKAYERGQPRARYKYSIDPTSGEIKKLCTSLRRNAKEERVLFHYNGHGVPLPTDNGEIWVFNTNYTQYIPLSIYELQGWMGIPSIYVYDCSNAGKIVKCFKTFTKLYEECKCIQLAACGEDEILPMNPELPADLFTSCLTTPIQIAVRYYLIQNRRRVSPEITIEMLDKIPGQLNDRRSMLGELNWIFTGITDTIAWNCLSRDLFQKLFRQDLLVASLFRSFLLAERIMRSYDCCPVSLPALPSTYKSHMWDSWDLVLKLSLQQLPKLLLRSEPNSGYISSLFFVEHLTAFELWLSLGSTKRAPPEQLPIVLQVLLSQVYRPKALELLGTFLNLGPSAVNLVLEVGIFPYILKLLQSPAKDLKPLLTLLWAKILAVDLCQVDMVRENGAKYFLDVLRNTSMSAEYRTMAAFINCVLVSDCIERQMRILQGGVLCDCLELLLDDHPPLRQWATILAALTWKNLPKARWEATRNNAPEKLAVLLSDSVPEVRASAVFALGTFIRSLPLNDPSEQGRSINHNIAVILRDKIACEASSLVRQEIVVALHYLILLYEATFCEVAKQYHDHSPKQSLITPTKQSTHSNKYFTMTPSPSMGRLNSDSSSQSQSIGTSPNSSTTNPSPQVISPMTMKRTGSLKSLASPGSGNLQSSLSFGRLYQKIYEAFLFFKDDPCLKVSSLASKIIDYINNKNISEDVVDFSSSFHKIHLALDSPRDLPPRRNNMMHQPHLDAEEKFVQPLVTTHLVEWCSKTFMKTSESFNIEEDYDLSSMFLPDKNFGSRMSLQEEKRFQHSPARKIEEQYFIQRQTRIPRNLLFHPTENYLVVADDNRLAIWDYEYRTNINSWTNGKREKISSLAIFNAKSNHSYLAVGCKNGVVRVWKDVFNAPENVSSNINQKTSDVEEWSSIELLCAFQGIKDLYTNRKVNGFLMRWEQKSSTLVMGGDSDKIHLWDMISERKVKDFATDGTQTTALHSSENNFWIVAGFNDGFVRLFDRRQHKPIVRQWRDFTTPIITTEVFNSSSSFAQVISATDTGEVRVYDLRRSSSMQVCSPDNHKIEAMAYHSKSHLIALGSLTQQIQINHTNGSKISAIKYYEGLVGQRMGSINCLQFHPSKVLLGVGTMDGYISIHGYSKK